MGEMIKRGEREREEEAAATCSRITFFFSFAERTQIPSLYVGRREKKKNTENKGHARSSVNCYGRDMRGKTWQDANVLES